MNDFDKIKSRIQNRRANARPTVIDISEIEKNYSKPNKFYRSVMLVLTIIAMFLSVAVYAKKDENGNLLKSTLGIDINFASFNKTLNKLLNFRVVDTLIEGEQVVSNVPRYIYTGNDLYLNSGSDVTSIDDGIVTYIYSDESGYLVIIENDSGFRSVYSNLVDISVKVNDRVYFDSIIGIVEEKVKIVFSKDNEKLSYEQVIELL